MRPRWDRGGRKDVPSEPPKPKRSHTIVTRMRLLRERVSPAALPSEICKPLLREVAKAVVQGRDDVTIRELEAAGVGRTYAATLAASGAIRRVRHGIYGEAKAVDADKMNENGT